MHESACFSQPCQQDVLSYFKIVAYLIGEKRCSPNLRVFNCELFEYLFTGLNVMSMFISEFSVPVFFPFFC